VALATLAPEIDFGAEDDEVRPAAMTPVMILSRICSGCQGAKEAARLKKMTRNKSVMKGACCGVAHAAAARSPASLLSFPRQLPGHACVSGCRQQASLLTVRREFTHDLAFLITRMRSASASTVSARSRARGWPCLPPRPGHLTTSSFAPRPCRGSARSRQHWAVGHHLARPTLLLMPPRAARKTPAEGGRNARGRCSIGGY